MERLQLRGAESRNRPGRWAREAMYLGYLDSESLRCRKQTRSSISRIKETSALATPRRRCLLILLSPRPGTQRLHGFRARWLARKRERGALMSFLGAPRTLFAIRVEDAALSISPRIRCSRARWQAASSTGCKAS